MTEKENTLTPEQIFEIDLTTETIMKLGAIENIESVDDQLSEVQIILGNFFNIAKERGKKEAEQSKWIPVEEKFPSGVPLNGFSKKWIHPDFNRDGICECWYDDLMGWVRCYWCNSCDEYHTSYSPPTHYSFKPTPPNHGKENENGPQ